MGRQRVHGEQQRCGDDCLNRRVRPVSAISLCCRRASSGSRMRALSLDRLARLPSLQVRPILAGLILLACCWTGSTDAQSRPEQHCNCTTCGTATTTCSTHGSCVITILRTKSGSWRVGKQHCVEQAEEIETCPNYYSSSALPEHSHSDVERASTVGVSICCRDGQRYCNGDIAGELAVRLHNWSYRPHSPLNILPAPSTSNAPEKTEESRSDNFTSKHVVFVSVAVSGIVVGTLAVMACLYRHFRSQPRSRPTTAAARTATCTEPRRKEKRTDGSSRVAMARTYQQHQKMFTQRNGLMDVDAGVMYHCTPARLAVEDPPPSWEESQRMKAEKRPQNEQRQPPLVKKAPLSWDSRYSGVVRAPPNRVCSNSLY